jgi:hypothetical protein
MKRVGIAFFLFAAACRGSQLPAERATWKLTEAEKPMAPAAQDVPPAPPLEPPGEFRGTTRQDAARLIRQATPLYQEVAAAADALPSDKEKLRALIAKGRRAQADLSTAAFIYLSLPPEAPDQADVRRRIGQLDEILAALKAALRKMSEKL